MIVAEPIQKRAEEFRSRYHSVREQIGRVIVGHDEIIHGVLTCLFVGGHCLLEGVPGLGKTLLVRTLAKTLDLHFSRIQFTPDLMPADILGTNMVMESPDGQAVLRVPARADLHANLPGRRNQSRHAQNAIGDARNDAGRLGHASAGTVHQLQAAVFRDGHAKSDRAGRHVSAARSAVRPLLLQAGGRLFDAARSWRRSSTARRAANVIEPDKVMDGAEILQWQQLVREVILAPHVQDYIVRLDAGHASRRPVRAADHQPISALGRQPARRADGGAGGQSAGAARRPLQRRASRTCGESICPRCGIA